MKKTLYVFIVLMFLNCFASNLKTDNTKWLYNAEDKVFYQLGISYCTNPKDEAIEKLAIFVPENYMKCSKNSDDTYTCKVNKKGTTGLYSAKTAPIVFPIETPGYVASKPLEEYKSFKEFTNNGFVYVYSGALGRETGAPWGVVDFKAAIRYIKYNKLAGDKNKIFTFGMSGGGAQSAIIGASGNSRLYKPYLKKIGAAKKSDNIKGCMAWCPITNLDSANAAYEWNMGSAREELSDFDKKISENLAREFAFFVNQKKFSDENHKRLTVTRLTDGSYKGGSYSEYVKKQIEKSLNNFLDDTTFPYSLEENIVNTADIPLEEANLPKKIKKSRKIKSPKNAPREDIFSAEDKKNITPEVREFSAPKDYIDYLNRNTEWVSFDPETQKVKITNINDFAKYIKNPEKPIGAFDALDKTTGENELFGENGSPAHFDIMTSRVLYYTDCRKDFEEDLKNKDELGYDTKTRLQMYTPLYYLMETYKTGKKSKIAPYWRIRSGIAQPDTALTTEINLALALLNNKKVKSVDFEMVWNKKHTKAERKGEPDTNFIDWINSLAR